MHADLELLSTTPLGHGLRRLFALEPEMHFLNHGSFGATPLHVLGAQDEWRSHFERQPIRFVGSELPEALRAVANRLAVFLGTSGQNLALVENATDGINAVLRSLRWRPGDEIVLANHAYTAVRHTVRFVAERYNLLVREAMIPFPLQNCQPIIDAYSAAITPRTRLVLVDHVFSSLALVIPLEEIVALCKQRGVQVLVDGAHAAGMLPLNLDVLGADWYTGNCHKWMFAAKGCAFLYAAPAAQADIHPTVISNFHGSGFPLEFDWQGTRDTSGWLAITAAMDFLAALGVERYRTHLQEQIEKIAELLCGVWQIEMPSPQLIRGAMLTLPLPDRFQTTQSSQSSLDDAARHWHDTLWREHRIEVPVLAFNDRLWIRVSAQIYNELSDYEALANALSPR